MGRKCSVCSSKQRAAIEEAILENRSLRDIAGQFGVSRSALKRHTDHGHIEQSIVEAHELKDVVHGKDLMQKVLFLQQEALAILQKAKETESHLIALTAIARASKLLELQGRVAGDIGAAQINIQQNVQFQEKTTSLFMATEIMKYLKNSYPEAAEGLIEHLEQEYWGAKNNGPDQGL